MAAAAFLDHIMSTEEGSTNHPEGAISAEIAARLEAELPLLADHLRTWLEAHLTPPREMAVSSDPEGTRPVRVWLVTDHIGQRDGSSRVVYDSARKMFGLLMEVSNGVLWYMGPYGSLVDTVESI